MQLKEKLLQEGFNDLTELYRCFPSQQIFSIENTDYYLEIYYSLNLVVFYKYSYSDNEGYCFECLKKYNEIPHDENNINEFIKKIKALVNMCSN